MRSPRMFVLLSQLLALARITSLTNAMTPEINFVSVMTKEINFVNALTSNEGKYKTMVIWKIENFVDMPYAKMSSTQNGGTFFKSQPFPEKSVNGVKWQFHLERNVSKTQNGDNETWINLTLFFEAPRNISGFSGSCQCGISGANGKNFDAIPSVKEVTTEDPVKFHPFVSLNQLKSNDNSLPNGHLTLHCVIEGHLKMNLASTNDVIASPMTKSSSCGSEIARANQNYLLNFRGYYSIIYTNYKNRNYHFVKQMFDQYVLQPGHVSLVISHLYEWHPSKEYFPTETHLVDFLTFIVKGEADNLEETCPQLYKTAQKYKFDCLMETCQDILPFTKK